jgi:parvulin-like peptidyl-prolyl isomerase
MGQRFTASRRNRWVLLGVSTFLVVATCAAVRFLWDPADANAQAPRPQGPNKPPVAVAAKSAPGKPGPRQSVIPQVVALVNNEQISKDELGKHCLKRYGVEILESMLNKRLIEQECEKRGITVTDKEIAEEVEKMAKRFGLPVDQWLKMLEEERDIAPNQYGRDIVWPTLALKKLAADRLTPTKEEIQEAYEMQFGPARQVRIIVCDLNEEAVKVLKMCQTKPEDFAKIAIEHSKDYNSASSGGLIQPVRKHMGDKRIEEAAFSLAPGQISSIIPVGNRYAIIRCERHIEARPVKFEMVEPQLVEAIRDTKLRKASTDVFKTLQERAKVTNVLNNAELRQKFPGVAAYINDQKISIEEVSEETLIRHGKKVLEALIARRLLEQALKTHKIVITQEDIQHELGEAAKSFEMVDKQGRPDIARFLEMVAKEQDLPSDQYIEQSVWPGVALTKLVEKEVQVTDEDVQKGYDANYGERVRCRAIVCTNQRRAREVWEMARRKPTTENFAALAEQYSDDPTSRALRGEIPPIARHSGRELLEKEAFRLQPGELSSVLQVDDKWVILLCEGRTKPVGVKIEDVAEEIKKEVFDKKLQMTMAQKYAEIKDGAQIDNILAGTSHSPAKPTGAGPQQPPRTSRAPAGTAIPPAR